MSDKPRGGIHKAAGVLSHLGGAGTSKIPSARKDHENLGFESRHLHHQDERMAKRLAVIDGVEVESMHTAKSYWKTGTGGDNIELPKPIQFPRGRPSDS